LNKQQVKVDFMIIESLSGSVVNHWVISGGDKTYRVFNNNFTDFLPNQSAPGLNIIELRTARCIGRKKIFF